MRSTSMNQLIAQSNDESNTAPLSDLQFLADVNENGGVTANDALNVINRLRVGSGT